MAVTRSRRISPGKVQDSKRLARLASELVEVLSEWWPASPNFLIAAQTLRNARVELDAIPVSQDPQPAANTQEPEKTGEQ